MARENYRNKTNEELEGISANYEQDAFSARLADKELDRREEETYRRTQEHIRRLQAQQSAAQIRFMFACNTFVGIVATSSCILTLVGTYPLTKPWIDQILRFLHIIP